jgi:hypothetical protein
MDAQTAMTITPIQGTLMGALLMVVWKLLDVAKQIFLKNKIPSEPAIANFACQQDPKYGERLRRIDQRMHDVHNYTEAVQLDIAKGVFGCQWKDREEVRDYIELVKRQVTATEAMVTGMTKLTEELRLARIKETP